MGYRHIGKRLTFSGTCFPKQYASPILRMGECACLPTSGTNIHSYLRGPKSANAVMAFLLRALLGMGRMILRDPVQHMVCRTDQLTVLLEPVRY